MLPLGHMGISVAVVRALESHFQSPWVDYRLLMIASLLPDLIDKPIKYLFGTHSIFGHSNYGHSLGFLFILLFCAGLQWYYRNNFILLIFCIGAFSHNILDIISHQEGWADKTLFNTNMLLAGEVVGGFILIYFFTSLVVNHSVVHFIKTGYFQ